MKDVYHFWISPVCIMYLFCGSWISYSYCILTVQVIVDLYASYNIAADYICGSMWHIDLVNILFVDLVYSFDL